MLDMCAERGVSVVIGAPYASGILVRGPEPGALYNYRAAKPEIIAKALIGLLVFSALAWVVNAGDCRDLWRTFRSGPAGQAS